MGATIEWSALPILIDVYGVEDPENLVVTLVAIRRELTVRARLEAEAQKG